MPNDKRGTLAMNTTRKIWLGLAALVTCAAPVVAYADAPGDAWAAAKGNLPASPGYVVGVNFATVKGSTLFKELMPAVLGQSGGAAKLEAFKADCSIDPVAMLQGLVVVADDKGQSVGFLSAKGLDKGKIETCLNKLATKDKKKLTIGKADAKGIVSYQADADNKLAVAYLPKGVFAVSDTAEHLAGFLGGKGVSAGTPAAKAFGTVNTGAALWFVANQEKEVSPPGNVTMKAAYGQAELASGNIAADIRLVTKTAAEATQLAGFATQQIDDAKKQGGIPPQMASVIKNLKIAPVGEEVQFKAQLPEKEALALITMAMSGGGGGGSPPPSAPAPAPEDSKK
jgi:hypothetical protein